MDPKFLQITTFNAQKKRKRLLIDIDSIFTITQNDNGGADIFYGGEFWAQSIEKYSEVSNALSNRKMIIKPKIKSSDKDVVKLLIPV